MESDTQNNDFAKAFQQVTNGLSNQQTDIPGASYYLNMTPNNLSTPDPQLRLLTENWHVDEEQ